MNFWYAIRPRSWIAYLLLPFSLLFWLLTVIRKSLFRLGIMKSYRAPIPVIVVGDLVGATITTAQYKVRCDFPRLW